MTGDREIGTVLGTWFDDGPTHAPDRMLDILGDRIARQRQQSAWRLAWRLPDVSTPIRLLAVAAALVAIIAAGAVLLGGGASPAVTPTGPSPSASAAPATSPGALVTCADATTGCAGPLDAGAHRTAQFSVPFSFTVPEGWDNPRDMARTYALDTTSAGLEFEVMAMNAIAEQTATCGPTAKAGAGSSVADIVDAVRTHPGLVAGEPVPAVVDGYQGQSVEFTVASDWDQHCPDADPALPAVVMLTDTGDPPGRAIVYTTNQRARWTVIDVAGETVIIEVVGPPGSSQFQSGLERTQPILDTIDFTPGG